MIIYSMLDIQDWLCEVRDRRQIESNFTDKHAALLEYKHIFDFVARYILDNRPQGLERGMDWSEYLNAFDLATLLDTYTNAR